MDGARSTELDTPSQFWGQAMTKWSLRTDNPIQAVHHTNQFRSSSSRFKLHSTPRPKVELVSSLHGTPLASPHRVAQLCRRDAKKILGIFVTHLASRDLAHRSRETRQPKHTKAANRSETRWRAQGSKDGESHPIWADHIARARQEIHCPYQIINTENNATHKHNHHRIELRQFHLVTGSKCNCTTIHSFAHVEHTVRSSVTRQQQQHDASLLQRSFRFPT